MCLYEAAIDDMINILRRVSDALLCCSSTLIERMEDVQKQPYRVALYCLAVTSPFTGYGIILQHGVQLADSKALCRSSARKFTLGEVRLYPWCW